LSIESGRWIFVNDRTLEFFESQRLKLLHEDVIVSTVAHDRQERLFFFYVGDDERRRRQRF